MILLNKNSTSKVVLTLSESVTIADPVYFLFEVISDEIELVKDYLGNAYLPNWNFNGIGDLVAGQGYQIKMNSSQVLQYNSNEAGY